MRHLFRRAPHARRAKRTRIRLARLVAHALRGLFCGVASAMRRLALRRRVVSSLPRRETRMACGERTESVLLCAGHGNLTLGERVDDACRLASLAPPLARRSPSATTTTSSPTT